MMNKSYDVYMCRGSRFRIETERQLSDAELLRSDVRYPTRDPYNKLIFHYRKIEDDAHLSPTTSGGEATWQVACGSINNYSPLKYWTDWQTINGGRPADIAKKEVNESFHEKGVTQKILNWLRLK